MSRPPITPAMKVGELLDHYPELEKRLIALAPAFAKLRNPLLRKTVARVATLEKAAKIGGVSVGSLVAALRGEREGVETERPAASPAGPVREAGENLIDLDLMLEAGAHPLGEILDRVRALEEGASLDLVASFRPEPLLERLEREAVTVSEATDAEGRFLFRMKRSGHG